MKQEHAGGTLGGRVPSTNRNGTSLNGGFTRKDCDSRGFICHTRSHLMKPKSHLNSHRQYWTRLHTYSACPHKSPISPIAVQGSPAQPFHAFQKASSAHMTPVKARYAPVWQSLCEPSGQVVVNTHCDMVTTPRVLFLQIILPEGQIPMGDLNKEISSVNQFRKQQGLDETSCFSVGI